MKFKRQLKRYLSYFDWYLGKCHLGSSKTAISWHIHLNNNNRMCVCVCVRVCVRVCVCNVRAA